MTFAGGTVTGQNDKRYHAFQRGAFASQGCAYKYKIIRRI